MQRGYKLYLIPNSALDYMHYCSDGANRDNGASFSNFLNCSNPGMLGDRRQISRSRRNGTDRRPNAGADHSCEPCLYGGHISHSTHTRANT